MDNWTPPGWEVTAGDPHPESGWRSIRLDCLAEGCTHRTYTGVPASVSVDSIVNGGHSRDHQDQHRPDRALDITVDWEVSACCSVCEDGIGDVVQADEGVECQDCGTYWGIDGTGGYRDDA